MSAAEGKTHIFAAQKNREKLDGNALGSIFETPLGRERLFTTDAIKKTILVRTHGRNRAGATEQMRLAE